MSVPNTRNGPLLDRQKYDQQEPCWRVSDSSGTVGAHDGIRTHDPNLTKIVRYPCATWAFWALAGEARLRLTRHYMFRRTGGQWRIRTSEGVIQLIYSQSRLATSVTAQESAPRTQWWVFSRWEPMVRIELTTCCLQNSCSAIELHRRDRRVGLCCASKAEVV